MIKVFKTWIERYLSDPEAILLLILILGGLAIILTFGDILMPVFVALAITVLLQYWVGWLEKFGVKRKNAYLLVYMVFLALFIACLVLLLPLLWRQCVNLINESPRMIENAKTLLLEYVKSGNGFVSEDYFDSVISGMSDETEAWTKKAISISIASIPGILTWIVYVILVPLLVFFFLKDSATIANWIKGFLPEKRGLIRKVWYEMNQQMANYVRGKVTEIIIVSIATYLVFLYFDLPYRILLAFLVGFSVVIPYVGIVVVTIPVILIGYLKWGFLGGFYGQFAMMMYAYTFVQLVDGGILVPLLFSEAVNLHPVAIVLAILFFGSIWGFWGVFFAIPLATLVKSVINAWPRKQHLQGNNHSNQHA